MQIGWKSAKNNVDSISNRNFEMEECVNEWINQKISIGHDAAMLAANKLCFYLFW